MKQPIPGFPRYTIDTDGTIIYNRGKKDKILIPRIHTKDKYLETRLTTSDGKRAPKKVHRLVALTYIPNPDNKPTVDHINGDIYDNRVENLRWATFCENTLNTNKFRSGGNFSVNKVSTPYGTTGYSVRVSIGNGEREYLGYRQNEEDAIQLRDAFYMNRIKNGLSVPNPILAYYVK